MSKTQVFARIGPLIGFSQSSAAAPIFHTLF